MSLHEDLSPMDLDDILVLLRVYRKRHEKALSIIDRAEEVCDYSGDTISDLREALEGEYDA